MIYLASPYSHPDPQVMHKRFKAVEAVTAELLRRGRFVYSPIVHCHALAQEYTLPTDFQFWKEYNLDFISRCRYFYVLTIDGWQESKGVTGELKAAEFWKIPRYFINEDLTTTYIGE